MMRPISWSLILLVGLTAGCGVRLERVTAAERAARTSGLPVGGSNAVALGDLAQFQPSTGLDAPGWSASGGLAVAPDGGGVQITATDAGPDYASAVYVLPPTDMSGTPVLHVRMLVPPGTPAPRVRADLVDADGHGTNAFPVEVQPTGEGTADLVFDFEDRFRSVWPEPALVDPTRIAAVALFLNYDGPAYTGAVTVERLARSPSRTVPATVLAPGAELFANDATGAVLIDDFNDGQLNFADPEIGTNSIGVSAGLVAGERDGHLVIQSNGAGVNYENVAFFFEPIDLESTPVVHLRMRLAAGSDPVQFRPDFVDVDGYGTSADPVVVTVESEEWRDYVLDYRGRFTSVFPEPRAVKGDQIGGVILFLNAGEGYTGTIEIDRMARSTSTTPPGDLGSDGAAASGSAPVAGAQAPGGTALIADFDTPYGASTTLGQRGWNSSLALTPGEGTVTLRGSSTPPNFDNAGLYFPLADFSDTPYLHVRMRTSVEPANVRIDLIQDNTYGTNADPVIQVVAPGDFRDYVFDFSDRFQAVWPDARPVDPTRIGGAAIFVNFDEAAFNGTLEIDRIVRSSSPEVPGQLTPAQVQSALSAGPAAAPAASGSAGAAVSADRLVALAEVEPGPVRTETLDSQVFLQRATEAAAAVDEAAVRARVDGLLARMTLEEKVGQMTQITLDVIADKSARPYGVDAAKLRRAIQDYHVGSILNVVDRAFTVEHWREVTAAIEAEAAGSRLGLPVVYGVDAVHGANYTADAALFPQNLGLAATFNPALVQEAGRITARDVRAGGVPWNFAPVLDLGRQPAWPRFYETFGEDPHVAAVMGVATVRGLEGERASSGLHTAATGKHFIGYSAARTGRDRTSTFLTERELWELYLPSFQAAIDAGIHSVMINSGDVNGVPVHASRALLTDLLRGELGFQGVAVSDWEDIKKLVGIHRVAETEREATRMAVMAGVDMSMVPNDYSFYDTLLSLARDGEVPMARIDEAVSRILRMKVLLGLFEAPATQGSAPEQVGSDDARRTALQAARESITLLRNRDAVLPLADDARVLVTGPAAASWRALNNGWTYTWQGDGAAEEYFPTDRPTIVEAIRAYAGADRVTYVPGADFEAPLDLAAAAAAARQSDVAVVVLGESSYAEIPGSITDLTLPRAQLDLLAAVAETGTPVVLVLVEGRPRTMADQADAPAAIVMAYNPGNEGGQAVADVLFGRVNPSGRLPFTYPAAPNMLVAYDRTRADDQDTGFGFNAFEPLARFGDGLSYTTFAASGLTVPATVSMDALDRGIPVEVTVQNTGSVAGAHAVLLYVSDAVASIAPAAERLVRFGKVMLEPGERRTLRFSLDAHALSFVDAEGVRRVEPGRFALRVDDQSAPMMLQGAAPRTLSR